MNEFLLRAYYIETTQIKLDAEVKSSQFLTDCFAGILFTKQTLPDQIKAIVRRNLGAKGRREIIKEEIRSLQSQVEDNMIDEFTSNIRIS